MVLTHPLLAAEVLTTLLAVFFIIGGGLRIAVAMFSGVAQPLPLLLNGVLTLLMGVLIFAKLPGSGAWVIGLFVGISLIFEGVWLVSVALTVASLPPPSAAPR
jgi:uncharacterized membrane protein HdeD (DUF308 family)